MEERKEQYVKKSSCILLVVLALFAGLFIGNTATVLYMGQRDGGPVQQVSTAKPQKQAAAVDPVKLRELEAATEADPTSADAWVSLGNYCFGKGLHQKAANAYERALELSPMRVGVWSDLGVMYRRLGRFDDALKSFKHAASLDPGHVTSRFNQGIVYLHDLNDRASALKVWQEVLALKPDAKAPNGASLKVMVEELQK